MGNECGGPRVSKGLTRSLNVKPLLTRGLLHFQKRLTQGAFRNIIRILSHNCSYDNFPGCLASQESRQPFLFPEF